jgi:lysine N6-hydroxylase
LATGNATRARYSCVGVGIGPANLSLASLLHDRPEVSNLFLERSPDFGWHDDQQIPGATLQVSMLKDLVSLSDPTSSFSFLSYLHAQGRIYHFINAQFDAVPRQEFRNYLEWASSRNPHLAYGEEVQGVDFDGTDFVVQTSRRTVLAENVVVGVGSHPWIPPVARDHLGDTQFHVSQYMRAAGDVRDKSVCIVGGGQSGAEAFLDLISRPPDRAPRRISWISRRPNYLPIDDSPFTNDYYMPCFSDYFFTLRPEIRLAFNHRQVLTSDGISEATLREIYQRIYVRRFIDGAADLVALYPNRRVAGVSSTSPGGWTLALEHNDHGDIDERIDAEVVVWATGFRPASMDFLAPIEHRLEREGGEFRIDEDFAVTWDGPADRRIFLQNAARGQRGLADPNLSLVAWRSQRIADRLSRVRGNEQLAGFIDWAIKPGRGSSTPAGIDG